MISFIFKFSFYFTISYAILCYPLKNGTIFQNLYSFTHPVTKEIYKETSGDVNKIINKTKKISKKLFTNSFPKKDHLKSLNKETSKKTNIVMEPEEAYTDQEREMLEKILTN